MISIGIDIGSVAAKGTAYDGEQIIAKEILPTGWSPRQAGEALIDLLITKGDFSKEDIKVMVGTGYGRVSLPFIEQKVTEITCHARGAHYFNSAIRTVIDIGGQDSKVIKLDEKGKVVDFIMNDKCAAGTGRFLQVMANVLELDISQLSEIALGATPCNINSMCTVFAESEVISLLAEGATKEEVAAGLLESVVNKTYAQVSKLGVDEEVYFTGGVAKSLYIKSRLGEKLKIGIHDSTDSQFNGAIGAALLGWDRLLKSR